MQFQENSRPLPPKKRPLWAQNAQKYPFLAKNGRVSLEYTRAIHDWTHMTRFDNKELFSSSAEKIQDY